MKTKKDKDTFAPDEANELKPAKKADKIGKEEESERKNAERVALDRVAPPQGDKS